jgi:hypothetical protein
LADFLSTLVKTLSIELSLKIRALKLHQLADGGKIIEAG